MARTPIMKRLMTLFKKTHDSDQSYPSDLEKQFIVTKKTLGVGSFAVVKECIRRSDNRPFALKIILKKAIAGTLTNLSVPIQRNLIILFFIIGKEHMLDSELGTRVLCDVLGVGEMTVNRIKDKASILGFRSDMILSQIFSSQLNIPTLYPWFTCQRLLKQFTL